MLKRRNKGRLAIYPGTFDPITNGHLSLIERAAGLFDRLLIAVSESASKKPFFTHQERFDLVEKSVKNMKCVSVIRFSGLLADLAKEYRACAIIRGLRAVSDFEYEFQMALMNRKLARDIETVFLMPSLSWVYLSSTIVKDVASNNGDIAGLAPAHVVKAIANKLQKNENPGRQI
jgi:pantetheine-phosphate adenylyltransferase